MSLHRSFYNPDPSFSSLFRLLDDFDSYSREVNQNPDNNGRRRQNQAVRTFSPRFDVHETQTAYELHGELPGIDREHINLEFTDPQTIVIRGRVERNYTSSTPPASTTNKGEDHHFHKATVEDEGAEQSKDQDNDAQVAKRSGGHVEKQKAPFEKLWVSERSVGEFSRTFSFPGRIDQDGVSASLNNGILSLVVPKSRKTETRRIAIN